MIGIFKRYFRPLLIGAIIFAPLILCGQRWVNMDSGFTHHVRDLYYDIDSSKLYAAGGFQYIANGGVVANGIASWNGLHWNPLGTGLCWPINTITKYKGEIYAGSSCDTLSRWDGSKWISMAEGFNGTVTELYSYEDNLYVLGNFTEAGGVLTQGIAKWDGLSWSAVDATPWVINYFFTAAYYKGELYVGGNLLMDVPFQIENIAKLTPSGWTPVGAGLQGSLADVVKLVVYKNELYAVGTFSKTENPDNPGNYIARWNGSEWKDVGDGVIGLGGGNGQIWDAYIQNNLLYVVGVFSYAGGLPMQYIAQWDGEKWCGINSLFNNTIGCITGNGADLFVGGGFNEIDGVVMNYVAHWEGGLFADSCQAVSIDEALDIGDVGIYPNPVTQSFQIILPDNMPACMVEVLDLTGKVMVGPFNFITSSSPVNVNGLSSGMYLVRAVSGNWNETYKIIKQ